MIRIQLVVYALILAVLTKVRSLSVTTAALNACECFDGHLTCDFYDLSKSQLKILIGILQDEDIKCGGDNDKPYFTDYITTKVSSSSSSSTDTLTSLTSVQMALSASQRGQLFSSPRDNDICRIGDGTTCTHVYEGLSYFFPSAILTHSLPLDKQVVSYTCQLAKLVLSLEKKSGKQQKTSSDAFQSSSGIFKKSSTNSALEWLKAIIGSRAELLLMQTNASNTIFEIDGWGSVMRAGQGLDMHVHTGAVFAGSYYLSAPPELGSVGESGGCLQFIDPRVGAEMAQVMRGRNIYGDAIEVCPSGEGGLLVMFPGWLPHEVKRMKPHFSGPRVAIDFVIKYMGFPGQ